MSGKRASTIEIARYYIQRGWAPVPIPAGQKKPVIKGWPALRLSEADVPQHFHEHDNLGLILGEPSGWLVDVDLDCPEARDLASRYLPATNAVTGRPGAPASHRWYIAEGAKTVKHQDPLDKSMIVELRSTGAQTVVGPSIHPSGEAYDVLVDEPAVVPAPMLTACVAALAEAVIKQRYPSPAEPKHPPPQPRCDAGDIERRALAYLDKLPPAISGQGGHNATYTAAVALVHGFRLEPDHALRLLLDHYNPRCEPPWTERELKHKVEDAANKPHEKPYGWLRDADRPEMPADPDVDISGIVGQVEGGNDPPLESPLDPGPVPDELMHVPGFIGEVMEFTLKNAPYPNAALAFCGAVALQSYLCGRKVCDPGDLRPNIYLLALASSGTGKDYPRKVNSRILYEIGHVHAMKGKVASGEGIEDALARTGTLLFQTDEMDGMLRQINFDRESKRESIPNVLLTLYTSAADLYPIRTKANQKEDVHIDQPHVTLFGTATPQYFYESLSTRMLTNGFFARLIVIDVGARGKYQPPRSARHLPESILAVARWWDEFQPGTSRKNLLEVHPEPKIVPYTPDAEAAISEIQQLADAEYDQAHQKNDEVARVVWSRTSENAKKLALIYAVSKNHLDPMVDLPAVQWATEFAMHQTRRQLYLAQIYVAENPFHAECLKFLRALKAKKDGQLTRSQLMRALRCKKADFDQLVDTLIAQGEIVTVEIPTKTRPAIGYQLATP